MRVQERMCVVCREMQDKKSLVRIVKNKDGRICLDKTYKMPGRGAYICKSQACREKLVKARGLERSFKCQIPTEIFDAVNQEIGE